MADLACELVTTFDYLNGLFSVSKTDLYAIKEIGEARYMQQLAVLEMAKCVLGENMKLADAYSSPMEVCD